MGEKLQNLEPREAKELLRGLSRGEALRELPHEGKGLLQALRGLSRGEALRELPREAKPFTRAKWESRFQRFAISFRPSALDVCSTSRVAQLYAAMSKGLLRGVTRQQ